MKKTATVVSCLLSALLLVSVSACGGGPGMTIIQDPTGSVIIQNGTSEAQIKGDTLPGGSASTVPAATPALTEAEPVITPSEVSQVSFSSYSDPSGYFTLDLPQGWQVKTGLKPNGAVDLISYAITVYDPKVPDRMLYFNLNTSGMVKSQEAHDWHVNNYGPQSFFAQGPIVTDFTTEAYFDGMSGWYGYSDFTLMENLGQSVLGGDIISARAVSAATGNEMEGLFTVTLSDVPMIVQRNLWDYSAGTLDAGTMAAYDIIMETAPTDEFTSWAPVLDRILGSINFTQSFMTQRQQAWAQVNKASQYIMSVNSEISDMIMDTWESSSRTYDVISQKEHDNIMGYDRIYDTERGEYYQADSGFLDGYTGSRYELVTDDAGFWAPVSGVINWK